MTFDGENLWVNDFAERKVFELDPEKNVLSSFQIPDETGGAKGITWDGEYLWASQRTNENWMDAKIYQIEIVDIS
jgi:hypothetical protein